MILKIPYRVLFCALSIAIAINIIGCGIKGGMSAHVAADKMCIVKIAKKQVGVRYVYGGKSTKGFDCSGLVWWVYNKNGLSIPRDSKGQAKVGRAISKGNIAPGDIVVFKLKNGRGGLHSAIYSGDGEFIHSPGRGKRVRADKIGDPYWAKKIYAIRRVSK